MLNRVVGLGVEQPATEEVLDAALDELAFARTLYVGLHPAARPPQLVDWLRARGFEPGWGWMLFTRGAGDPPRVASDLEVKEVAPGDGAAFARVVRRAYGLPAAVEPWLGGLPSAPGWSVWVGLDRGEAVAAGALFVADGAGYLSLAGTLPEHRGHGGQGALFAARIRKARELGCDLLVTETGERIPDRPSSSYRNVLRFGFEEQFVVGNWIRSSP